MVKPIRISISGTGGLTDAPTVEDLLKQLRDFFEILVSVDAAVSEEGGVAMEWRITDAGRNSPLTFEATPFPLDHATNIDRRAAVVQHAVATGFQALQTERVRPSYFNEAVLAKIDKMSERLTNGLNLTTIDFGTDDAPLIVTPTVAREISKNLRAIREPKERSFRELGSIEGYYVGVERDGHNRSILHIRDRIFGDLIKCVLRKRAVETVSEHKVKQVLGRARLLVSGTIHYRGLANINYVDADEVRVMRAREDLPSVEDIIDPHFTNGMSSEEYLKALRNGQLN